MDEIVRSVSRALRIVEILNERPSTSLETLHQSTGMPKSTLVRLLETLIEAGYVLRLSRREGYSVTDSVLRLSAGVRRRDALVDAARPEMEKFTREHKWQVSLGTYEVDGMLIRATTRDISPFSRDEIYLNRKVGVLSSIVGRAYFAFCSPTERQVMLQMLKSSWHEGDARRAQNEQRMEAMACKIRELGYAAGWPARPGAYRSFAVPVLAVEPSDAVLGALVMFWYASVMSEPQAVLKHLDRVHAMVAEIARTVNDHLCASACGPVDDRPVGKSRPPFGATPRRGGTYGGIHGAAAAPGR
jgi:IclR family mhp operon transcriptional activator